MHGALKQGGKNTVVAQSAVGAEKATVERGQHVAKGGGLPGGERGHRAMQPGEGDEGTGDVGEENIFRTDLDF